ncbi:MAG: NAD-dependent epimerase/dehydratase family protein, partial [Nitrospinae bacterium]|nr:NAD-dependent epimerase/dehydratase family protein [Nitrospinota bacterium]
FYRTNVLGARNVLEGCRGEGVSRLVYTSTPSVIFDGAPHGGVDESRPYPARFFAPYPESKAVAEREILAANGAGLYTCALRPHLIWGPGDPHLIPGVVRAARAGRMKIVGDGTNRSDVVYVDNAADAHIGALDRLVPGSPVGGRAYFVSQGAPVNLWGFINTILERLGEPAITGRMSYRVAYALGAAAETAWRLMGRGDDPPMTRFMAMNLAHDHWFVIDRVRRELDYVPQVSTVEGLDRLARWWREEQA